MAVRASTAAMVIAALLVFLCVSCVFSCDVQLLDKIDSTFCQISGKLIDGQTILPNHRSQLTILET